MAVTKVDIWEHLASSNDFIVKFKGDTNSATSSFARFATSKANLDNPATYYEVQTSAGSSASLFAGRYSDTGGPALVSGQIYWTQCVVDGVLSMKQAFAMGTLPALPQQDQVFLDDFHRADNPLTLGNGWTPDVGTVYGILSNQAVLKSTDFANNAMVCQDPGLSDFYVKLTTPNGALAVDECEMEIFVAAENDFVEVFFSSSAYPPGTYTAMILNSWSAALSMFGPKVGTAFEAGENLGIRVKGDDMFFYVDDVFTFGLDLLTWPLAAVYTRGATKVGMTDYTVDALDISQFLVSVDHVPVTNRPTDKQYPFMVQVQITKNGVLMTQNSLPIITWYDGSKRAQWDNLWYPATDLGDGSFSIDTSDAGSILEGV